MNLLTRVDASVISKEDLMLAHDEKYIDDMFYLFTLSEPQIIKALAKMDSMFGNQHSLLGARVAAGSTLNLMKAILNGEVRHGVANVRSPGHHCFADRPGGFCFFNNAIIATKYAIQCGKRVAVIDWDIHFGDASFDILQHDKNALFININRYDHGCFYPGTGKAKNTDNVLSIEVNKIAHDKDYYEIFNNQVLPKIADFNPDIIVVSAGFDAGQHDPLGGFKLTPECFYNMTNMLLYFKKPVLMVLEGGYNLTTISNSMAECTRALLEDVKLL